MYFHFAEKQKKKNKKSHLIFSGVSLFRLHVSSLIALKNEEEFRSTPPGDDIVVRIIVDFVSDRRDREDKPRRKPPRLLKTFLVSFLKSNKKL